MNRTCVRIGIALFGALLLESSTALANGGPFLVRRPGGDPAAKGVLAPLLPDLMPGTESRLEVEREDLSFQFATSRRGPVVHVGARYTIRNPTDKDVTLALGFPILRGIYSEYRSGGMGLGHSVPAYRVMADGRTIASTIISNSDLFDRIRQHAYGIIVAGMDAEPTLRELRARLGGDVATVLDGARAELERYLREQKQWEARDAALLADLMRAVAPKPTPRTAEQRQPIRWSPYAAGPPPMPTFHVDQIDFRMGGHLHRAYLGPLAAIGELKATQVLSHLAARFSPGAATDYERVFKAWGGDVREQAIDLRAGTLRPRQRPADDQESIYARIDYFEPDSILDPDRRAACQAILKNLPVTFTFAPMNLIRTDVTFPHGATRTVTFDYSQHPFADSAEPATLQLAYVVHPASFWKSFGPMRVTVIVPEQVPFAASIPMRKETAPPKQPGFATFAAEVVRKTGELFLSVGAEGWETLGRDARYRVRAPAIERSPLDALSSDLPDFDD